MAAFEFANRLLDKDPFWVDVNNDGDHPGPGRDLPPTVDAGPDVSGFEGAPIDLNGIADDDQGTPTVHWSYSAGPDVDPGTTCTFGNPDGTSSTFTCTDDGTFTLTLTADDGVNSPVSDSLVAHVRNVPPKFRRFEYRRAAATASSGVGPAPWSLFRVGDTVHLTAPYVDPGSNDTQTCVVDWDDGRPAERYPASDSGCDRPHVYHDAGMYTVTTTVSDDDGGTDSWTTMLVVYDPAGGIGRGNGWLTAPGQGGFAFTSSYPTPAATVPDGAVAFALPPAADLDLRNHQHLD